MNDLRDQQRERRWESEARFFDQWAEESNGDVGRTDPKVVTRYRAPGRLYHKEARFRILGELAGRTVLDVGCGDGQNAVLLAELGAEVTGIDVSPKAIAKAERRAQNAHVDDRCRFVCSPLETAGDLGGPFDVVWGDAVLHHLIDEFDDVINRLVNVTSPGGLHLYSEPINLCQTLRRFRNLIPIKTEATPDERPLERREIELLRRFLPGLTVIPFHMFGRLHPFILKDCSMEESGVLRRTASLSLAALDNLLFKAPLVDRLAGYAVLVGRTSVARNTVDC